MNSSVPPRLAEAGAGEDVPYRTVVISSQDSPNGTPREYVFSGRIFTEQDVAGYLARHPGSVIVSDEVIPDGIDTAAAAVANALGADAREARQAREDREAPRGSWADYTAPLLTDRPQSERCQCHANFRESDPYQGGRPFGDYDTDARRFLAQALDHNDGQPHVMQNHTEGPDEWRAAHDIARRVIAWVSRQPDSALSEWCARAEQTAHLQHALAGMLIKLDHPLVEQVIGAVTAVLADYYDPTFYERL